MLLGYDIPMVQLFCNAWVSGIEVDSLTEYLSQKSHSSQTGDPCRYPLRSWLSVEIFWKQSNNVLFGGHKWRLLSSFLSRRKYEICVWKIAHFGIKYFPLTITTFTVMFVPLCLNLYYFLNLFYCTNETKVNRPRIGSWAWSSTCLSPLTFVLVEVTSSLTLHQFLFWIASDCLPQTTDLYNFLAMAVTLLSFPNIVGQLSWVLCRLSDVNGMIVFYQFNFYRQLCNWMTFSNLQLKLNAKL